MCGQNEPIGTNLSTWLKSRLLIGTRGLRPQFILGKHGLGFLGCGVSLPKSEFSAPLSSHILDFYTELVSTHSEADVQRLGVRISSQFFFVDDEVETKLEGLEGLGYRRKWKEECRRFFEIIIGFAQVNQCCCF